MTEKCGKSNFQENSDEMLEISPKRSTSTTSSDNEKQNNCGILKEKISSSKNSNNFEFLMLTKISHLPAYQIPWLMDNLHQMMKMD